MVHIVTASGLKEIGSWGIQLQGHAANDGRLDSSALLAAAHDLLVLDFSSDGTEEGRYIGEEIHRLQARSDNSSVLAYLPIGAVYDYRSNWLRTWTSDGQASGQLTARAPSWLGPVHPSCANARLVRYWDSGWQDALFDERRTGWTDLIAAQSFDGVYLDLIDTFAAWGRGGGGGSSGEPASLQDAARRMIDAVCSMAVHIRSRYPDFLVVPVNAETILQAAGDAASRSKFLAAISAVVAEDVYCPGAQRENNPLQPDAARLALLATEFRDAGKPVLSVEYINESAQAAAYCERCAGDGFVPYAAPSRDLDRLGPAFAGEIAFAAKPPGQLPSAPTRSGVAPVKARPGEAPRFRWRPGQPGPGQAGPGQAGPGQAGPGQAGPGQAGPGQATGA